MTDAPKPRILVVDDEPAIRELLQRLLQDYFTVHTCADAREAEDLLSRADYCVLLCDDRMPGESGLDFMARIRGRHPHLQRLLLSGMADHERLTLAINRAQVDHYVSKTTDFSVIRRICLESAQRSLSARRAHAEALEQELLQRHTKGWERWRLETQRAVHHLTHSLPVLLAGVVIVGFATALVGVLVLTALYFLKSALGIDVIHSHHLIDFFR
ncbi:MAG: response regulator [Candidatus Methylacidiphilales bacterium]|nr:response regulator [Candidatus Methylacidiphilales bacterium]